MRSDVTGHLPLPADGFVATWATRVDDTNLDDTNLDVQDDQSDQTEHEEHLTLRWENEAWTATGVVGAERIEYVMRITAQWHISQFLLFRDLEEADLWLGTDGHGRWGEVNGAHRPDLDGATDLALTCTPFTHTLPIRRLPLRIGNAAELSVLLVDVRTLGVVTSRARYERLEDRRWRHERDGVAVDFVVDEFGLPLDVGAGYRRVA